MSRRVLCAAFAAGAALSGCGGSSTTASPTPTVGSSVGDVAPALTGTSLQGHAVSTTAWHGSVVVVVFWASWCVPCRDEQPSLNTLARKETALGVHFVGVSVDADRSAARGYMVQFGVPYDSLIDRSETIVSEYAVVGPPTTFVIGRGGRVADELIGELNMDVLRSDIHIAQTA